MRALILWVMILATLLGSPAQADEKSHREAAEELLRVTKADQLIKPLFAQVQSMMEQQFVQMGVSEDFRPILKRHQERLFAALEEILDWRTLKDEIASAYMDTFTEEELTDIIAFYKTPVGQVYVDKMPALMAKSMQATQKRMPQIVEKMTEVTAKLMEEMREEVVRKKAERKKETQKSDL